jgi:2-dehydropantoate 2-reductase
VRVVVIGAGAMGALLGARLAASGHDVLLYDVWREHVAAIQRDGLLVEELDGTLVRYQARATDQPPLAIGMADLVLVQVKAYDTLTALAPFAGKLRPDTYVLSLQNGLGNLEQARRALPGHERLLLGTTAHASMVTRPGRLRHAGKGPNVIGDPDGARFDLTQIAAALNGAGFETEIASDVLAKVWTKLAANVAINPFCALTGSLIGAIYDDPDLSSMSRAAVLEFDAVREAAGVARAERDYVAYSRHIMELTRRNPASMLQDIRAGRRTEIDAINCAIARLGEELGVATPVNHWLTALVRQREADARRTRSTVQED